MQNRPGYRGPTAHCAFLPPRLRAALSAAERVSAAAAARACAAAAAVVTGDCSCDWMRSVRWLRRIFADAWPRPDVGSIVRGLKGVRPHELAQGHHRAAAGRQWRLLQFAFSAALARIRRIDLAGSTEPLLCACRPTIPVGWRRHLVRRRSCQGGPCCRRCRRHLVSVQGAVAVRCRAPSRSDQLPRAGRPQPLVAPLRRPCRLCRRNPSQSLSMSLSYSQSYSYSHSQSQSLSLSPRRRLCLSPPQMSLSWS